MATTERRLDRADRASEHALLAIGREIREARSNAGLSQAAVAMAAGVSRSRASRIERAEISSASVRVLARLCAAVGLDLGVRTYPAGDPLRDVAQVRLLERFRARLHPALRWRTEVPLPIPGDRRAWDAVIGGDGWRMPVEAETRIADAQALARRLALKLRDGGFDHVILVVADSRTNRAALDAAGTELAHAFPAKRSVLINALSAGEDPRASGIVVI